MYIAITALGVLVQNFHQLHRKENFKNC